MTNPEVSARVGYLVSCYPDTSHTFIRREIAALRRKGAEIHSFTVREPGLNALFSEEDAKERENTWSILPASFGKLVKSHALGVLKRPRRYGSTFIRALRDRPPGMKACIWRFFYFAEAIILARELERRRITHLHNHFANSGGDVGCLASYFLGIGWSQTLHGSADFERPRALLGRKTATAIFTACASNFVRAQAMWASNPEHWDRLLLVRCGVELYRLVPRHVSAVGKPPIVLTVGRLSPEKGQLGLIKAFGNVIASGIEANLRIIGRGPEYIRLSNAIREEGLSEKAELVGALAEEQVLEEMRCADLLVLTSFTEGLPVVLIEAMAIGLPVVAPNITGIPEIVEDKVTGHLFSPGNWEELSSLLKNLLTSARVREATVESARVRVTAEFDIDRAVEPLWAKFCDSSPAAE